MTEIDELEGKKLDQAIHEMRGMKPRWEAVVYNSDDSGIVATTSSAGPWFTPAELRDWLEDAQNQGRLQNYHIKTTPHYPPYSSDIAQAMELVKEVCTPYLIDGLWARFCFRLQYSGDTFCAWLDRWSTEPEVHAEYDAPTAPTAICRAYLKAKEGA